MLVLLFEKEELRRLELLLFELHLSDFIDRLVEFLLLCSFDELFGNRATSCTELEIMLSLDFPTLFLLAEVLLVVPGRLVLMPLSLLLLHSKDSSIEFLPFGSMLEVL